MDDKQKIKREIISFYSKNKRFPTIFFLMTILKMDMNKIKMLLKELEAEKFLYKYGMNYFFNKKIQEDNRNKIIKTTVNPIQPSVPALKIIKKSIKIKVFNSENFIRFIMFLISVTAIYISIHYSFTWLSTFLDFFKAIMLSTVMTLYTTFALESCFLIWRIKRISNVVFGIIILITSVAALFFSMSMTIIGQYNKKIDIIYNQKTENIINNKEIAEQELLKTEREETKEKINMIRNEIIINQNILSGFKKEDTGSYEYKLLLWKLSDLNLKLKPCEEKLNKIDNDIMINIKSSKNTEKIIKDDNFYTWFAKTFNFKTGIVEFILYLIPALFIDIMAPLGMLIALGFYRSKKY